jgi:hypothetical protein
MPNNERRPGQGASHVETVGGSDAWIVVDEARAINFGLSRWPQASGRS